MEVNIKVVTCAFCGLIVFGEPAVAHFAARCEFRNECAYPDGGDAHKNLSDSLDGIAKAASGVTGWIGTIS